MNDKMQDSCVAALLLLSVTVSMGLSKAAKAQESIVRFELAEQLRIGHKPFSRDSLLLGSTGRMAIGRTGHIYVADASVPTVYVFSASGDFVISIGRRGEGPGEFVELNGIFVGDNDSLFVFDINLRRISVFAPETHQFAYSVSVHGDAKSSPHRFLGVSEKGYLMVYQSSYYTAGGAGLGPDADRFATAKLVNRSGAIAREVMTLPDHESLVITNNRGGITAAMLPYGRLYQYQLAANGLLYGGYNESIDIKVSSADGEARKTIHHPHNAIRLTRKDIDAAFADVKREYWRTLRTVLADTKPAWTSFVVDNQERVWVRSYYDLFADPEPSEMTWTVLNPEGEIVGEVELPRRLAIRVIQAGIAYGVVYDYDSGPYVAVYAITER